MKNTYRKAIFIVVYAKTSSGKIEYLLLKRKKHWKGWEFPKGGIEAGETKLVTVKRELKEETGLAPIKIKKFKIKGSYRYEKKFKDRPGIVGQTYYLFSVETKKGNVKLDKREKEHTSYKWVLFKEAEKLLTWPNQKRCLKIVNNWFKK